MFISGFFFVFFRLDMVVVFVFIFLWFFWYSFFFCWIKGGNFVLCCMVGYFRWCVMIIFEVIIFRVFEFEYIIFLNYWVWLVKYDCNVKRNFCYWIFLSEVL